VTIFSSLYTSRLDIELGTDDSTTLFTTARRKSAINRGVSEFAELTECFTKWSTLAITSTDAGEVDLSSRLTDFVRLAKTPISFEYINASSQLTALSGQDDLPHVGDVKWLDDNEPGWRETTVSTTQQLPERTYERLDGTAHYLGFFPPPSSGSSAAMSVRLQYVAQPAAMTSDTNEPYGAARVDLRPWHQAAVHYGAHVLEKLRRDDQASQAQLQQFLGYVSRYIQNTRKKGGQVLSQTRRYFNTRSRQTERDPRT